MITPGKAPEKGEIQEQGFGPADIVVGIASYNNARTIGHVVKAVDLGLTKYFPQEKSVIVNSDGGSTDGTSELVLNSMLDHRAAFLYHHLYPVHRISMPYHGIPGKGSALKAIFQQAADLGAKACCVVDADLKSITPEWIELLVTPVLRHGFDFVAPLYSRHKYDGTITNSIVYPLTRALYGKRIRQPIGGDFGFSGRMAEFYLSQNVWDSDIARFGIDIWMTTEAVAGGFNICQSYLGAKIHDPKDPGADLRDMFVQVIGSLMSLTEKHYEQWNTASGSVDIPTLGFRYSVGVVPIPIKMEGMLKSFALAVENLSDVWSSFISKDILGAISRISTERLSDFRFPNEVWVRIVYDFLGAYHHRKLSPDHLLKSLLPLYYGKTASFFMEVADMTEEEAETAIEMLCLEYENQKEYLIRNW